MLAVALPVARADDAPQWTVPALDASGVLVAMRIGVSLAWPGAYDPTAFSRNAAQFVESWTHAPDFRRDRPLLESDGDP